MKAYLKDKKNIHFLTIEKISNGFLIASSDLEGPILKIHKSTLNGVVNVMEEIWDVSYIKDPESPPLTSIKKEKKVKKQATKKSKRTKKCIK